MSEHLSDPEDMHTVVPRWTWIALALMVIGVILIGAGVVAESWVWAGPGIVVLVLGGGLGAALSSANVKAASCQGTRMLSGARSITSASASGGLADTQDDQHTVGKIDPR